MKQKNPFTVVGYNGPEYFCDRVKETKKLLSAIRNDRNVTLIAPRRYGKTGLIHHVHKMMPSEYMGVYLDIFALKSLTEFAKVFATAVIGTIDTPTEKAISAVARFFKSCRPTITPQENGMPKFSFDIMPSRAQDTLAETFAYLKKRNRRAVIAIDEFQQILEFPETGTEALFRSYVQEVPWIRFIFAGSRHHLMGEMFLSAKHPFYQSTDVLSLNVIAKEPYTEFAKKHFVAARQRFSTEAFNALYERFSGVTWYVQTILNHIWAAGEGFVSPNQIDEVITDLMEDRSLVFRDLYFSQNVSSQRLLAAISAEGEVKNIFSGDFMRRHSLVATSSVRSALKVLLDNDLVYRTERGYVIYDRIFGEWLHRNIG
ncbi:MAG: ATP-binding protein [Kiritimatiellae bacterium]|nr:ATP-binding protein [Kiritimatiellia bacterium]